MRTLRLIDKESSIEESIDRSEVNKLLETNELASSWNCSFSFEGGSSVQIRASGSFKNSGLFLSGDEDQWEIIKDEYGEVILINKNLGYKKGKKRGFP